MFKYDEHRKRFFEVMHRIGKVDKHKDGSLELDKQYSAALYILTASRSTWNKAEDYVSSHGIRFYDLLAEIDFSHAYSSILYLAWSLFKGGNNTEVTVQEVLDGDATAPELLNGKVDIGRCVSSLDENNFKIAIEAILIGRYGVPQEEEKP